MCGEYLLPPLSKVRAVCGSTACTDLRGGRRVIGVPTATSGVGVYVYGYNSGEVCPSQNGWPERGALATSTGTVPGVSLDHLSRRIATYNCRGRTRSCRAGTHSHRRPET